MPRVKFRKMMSATDNGVRKAPFPKDTRQDPVEWIKMMGQIKKIGDLM